MAIVEKRTIKLGWQDVCEMVSAEIKGLIGVEVICKAQPMELEHWEITFGGYRLPLPKLCLLLQGVGASLGDWEDSLPDEGGTTVAGLGMALSEKLLARHLKLTWEHSLILEDSLWLVGIQNTRGDET